MKRSPPSTSPLKDGSPIVDEAQFSDFGLVQGFSTLPAMPPAVAGGIQSASSVYHHIHETSSKRLRTLDYLRAAHEGHVYWFKTTHFSKADLSRMPYFDKRKLSRRAVNFLFLGLSLPPILDVNSNLQDYLKSLTTLLQEFESFQQSHPIDGGSGSTLARARLPHMFKRSGHTSAKGRRTSSATEIGLPMQSSDQSELKAMGNVASSTNIASSASQYPVGSESSDLLPGEEYSLLLTPTVPFDLDYFEVFASLCEILIDCYTRLTTLVSSPAVCTVAVSDLFAKLDLKMRKIMIAGIVKEFEDYGRTAAKQQVAGVGRVVLGGLLG